MEKKSFLNWTAMAVLIVLSVSCQEEPFQIQSGDVVDCGDCVDIPPGGGTLYGPDLIVNSVISYGTIGNNMDYGVSIKNIGNAVANIDYTNNRVAWQAWLSRDGITRDVPACGSSFGSVALGINQIAVKRMVCTFPSTVNFSLYRAMIVELKVSSNIGESVTSNNTFVRTPLPF
jgi:hypothetical protein